MPDMERPVNALCRRPIPVKCSVHGARRSPSPSSDGSNCRCVRGENFASVLGERCSGIANRLGRISILLGTHDARVYPSSVGLASTKRTSTGSFDLPGRSHGLGEWTRRVGGHLAMMGHVNTVEVVVAHSERATLRVGDVFLKVDADQTRIDVEVEAMAIAPIPTPQVLWRKPPVLALAAVRGVALGHLGEPSTASAAAWVAAGAAVRRLHDAPLPRWSWSERRRARIAPRRRMRLADRQRCRCRSGRHAEP